MIRRPRYTCRSRRMTRAQRDALQAHEGLYSIKKSDALVDLHALFKTRAPLIMEIGFGMGEHLAFMSKAEPEKHYIGVEVYQAGVGSLLSQLERQDNVRVFCEDAGHVLSHNIPNASLHEVWILFPDPWPKRRHHKRRLITPAFMDLLASKLVPKGFVYLATDHADYAQHISHVMAQKSSFIPLTKEETAIECERHACTSKYEHYGKRRGHVIHKWFFRVQYLENSV